MPGVRLLVSREGNGPGLEKKARKPMGWISSSFTFYEKPKIIFRCLLNDML